MTHRAPGAEPAAAGTISIGPDHVITVLSAEPPFADLLALAAETLNDSDVFMVRTAPAPDDPPMRLRKRRVPRDAPDAGEAVIELLRRNHGFELTPVG